MSCPCGSSICDCRIECLCPQDQCQCNKCSSIPKICSRCNLPFYIIVHETENVRCICSCKAKSNLFPSKSDCLSRNSAAYNEKIISSIRETQCPRCSLPIIIVTKSEDYQSFDSCCCSYKNSDSNTTGKTTVHETLNCTSDLRDTTEDRQARKTSPRTEKSTLQYKNAEGKHLTNSDDDSDTGTLTSVEFLIEDPKSRVQDNPESRMPCTESVTSDSNLQNFYFDSNTQSPTGLFSRAGDNSLSNTSLFAGISGLSSPSASKDFISPPENPGFFQLSQNIRPKLPPPFRTLPKPIPGVPAFRSCGGRDLSQHMKKPRSVYPPVTDQPALVCGRDLSHQMKKPRSVRPPVTDQPALACAEKIEKWFGTFQTVLTINGQLPDAEKAAFIDKKDKENIKRQPKDLLYDRFESKSAGKNIKPFTSSKGLRRMSHVKPAITKQSNGKDFVSDPTTDTDRSSSLSKSRKESESE